MSNKKKMSLVIMLALFAVIGISFAYFTAQVGELVTRDVRIQTHTTDLLTFDIDDDIEFEVTQADFARGNGNKFGETSVTAVLTPNSATGEAAKNYTLYLNISTNELRHCSTNINNDPELLLQVFDKSGQLVDLVGLGSPKTVKNLTGYDITGKTGLVTLLNNHLITASNYTVTEEEYRVVITMINLDVDQECNTGKRVLAKLTIQTELVRGIAPVSVQECSGEDCGIAETMLIPSIMENDNVEEEIFTVYTVGYVEPSETESTYSIKFENLGFDFDDYELVLEGTPAVMTTQTDYENYIDVKDNGELLTNNTEGHNRKANATAEELYNYSLDENELSIEDVIISCNKRDCTATISESFNNISNLITHDTTTDDNDNLSVLYNGIKFNLKRVKVIKAAHLEYANNKYTECVDTQCAIDELYDYTESGLSTELIAGLYRYQGSEVDNFICFGTTNKNTCLSDTDRYMYRIIGVSPNGQMKLIKKEALNTAYAWSTPTTSLVSWTDSLLYNGLNGNYFLTNATYIPSGWSDRIAVTSWHYGDLTNENASVSEVATTEANFASTVNSKIGLMYVSDFIYGMPDGKNCSSNCSYDFQPSWLYLIRNENDIGAPSKSEWTMTRSEDYNNWYGKSWCINYDSFNITTNSYFTALSVRPVFYLNANQTISSGSGSISDPYLLS